jgi:hypothetical protein
MSAPAATVRQAPTGIWLDSGHSTKITLANNPSISFWEKTVTPPGFDAGDAIDTTNMHNVRYVSKAPQPLIDMTDISGTCSYDPGVLTQIEAIMGIHTTVTVTHPDGTTWAQYGFLKSFTPQENSRNNQPMANYTIVITNYDRTGHVTAGPTVVSVAGT